MTKDEFLQELRKRGYTADIENGCVVVVSEDTIFDKIYDVALKCDYCGSFTWRKAQ